MNKETEPLNWTGAKFNYENMFRKRVIGDGSCYFHSIIDSCFIPARTGWLHGKPFDRFQFTKTFRNDLSYILDKPRPGYKGKNYYNTLSRGQLSSLSTVKLPVDIHVHTSLSDMKKDLLSGNSVNYIYHELVSDVLDLDIYILNLNSKDVYIVDSDFELYYKNRNSIVLLYIPGHFEVVAIKYNRELITYFDPEDPFIQSIQARMITMSGKNKNDKIS
uniref:OTU-like cysteine protease n=1 Tax=Pithovirus LCPAC001 TaxID=2506585 RepID=A0A481Z1H6_9VIRU|nr:MAG: OTU-like cysteine protease [Pithovirus LCPAC001]